MKEISKNLSNQAEVKISKMQKIWDVRSENKNAYLKLLAKDKSIGLILDQFTDGYPTAKTCLPFEGTHYFRPKGHARSFCIRTNGGGVLVFKGTEPMSEDYPKIIREAWKLRTTYHLSRIEHFLLVENEIYLAMTVAGSLFCAQQSLEWNSTYLKRFSKLPMTPFPLMVLKVPDVDASVFAKKSRPFLSDRGQNSALKRFQQLAKAGLGVYVYYYPEIPIRAAHTKGLFLGSGGVGLGGTAEPSSIPQIDIEKMLEGWTSLLSEMLIAGFFPTTKLHTGNCLQLQNLAVGGGFCDIDSIEPMTRIKNDDDFFGTLIFSLGELVTSMSEFLNLDRSPAGAALWVFVWNQVRNNILTHPKKRGCDPRLRDIFKADGLPLVNWLASHIR